MHCKNPGIAIRAVGAISHFGVGYPAYLNGLFHPEVSGENPKSSEYEMASGAIQEALQLSTQVNVERSALVLATTARQMDGSSAVSLLKRLATDNGITGTQLCFVNACSAGSSALGAASSLILSGTAETVLLVGVVADLEDNRKGFASLGVTGDQPARPFSSDRKFMEIGTGSVCILLKKAQHERDICVHSVMTGFGGKNLIRPDQDFLSHFYCHAVHSSENHPEVFLAHGTGTIPNDQAESAALSVAFPSGVKVSSIKSSAGHTLEASLLFQLAAAYGSVLKKQLPVTRNCTDSILPVPLVICDHEETLADSPSTIMGASIGMDGNTGVFSDGKNLTSVSEKQLFPVAVSHFTPWTHLETPVERFPGEPVGGAADVINTVLQEIYSTYPQVPLFDEMSELVLSVFSDECFPGKFTGRRMTPADFFGRLYSFPLAMAARQVKHKGSLSTLRIHPDNLLDVLTYSWSQIATGMLNVCLVLDMDYRDGRSFCRGIILAIDSVSDELTHCSLDELAKYL